MFLSTLPPGLAFELIRFSDVESDMGTTTFGLGQMVGCSNLAVSVYPCTKQFVCVCMYAKSDKSCGLFRVASCSINGPWLCWSHSNMT